MVLKKTHAPPLSILVQSLLDTTARFNVIVVFGKGNASVRYYNLVLFWAYIWILFLMVRHCSLYAFSEPMSLSSGKSKTKLLIFFSPKFSLPCNMENYFGGLIWVFFLKCWGSSKYIESKVKLFCSFFCRLPLWKWGISLFLKDQGPNIFQKDNSCAILHIWYVSHMF